MKLKVWGKEIVMFIVSRILEHQNPKHTHQLTTDRFMLEELVQILDNTAYTSQISKYLLTDGKRNKTSLQLVQS